MDSIHSRYSSLRSNLFPGVRLVAITKGRTPREVQAVVEAGALEIGESRVAEAAEKFPKCRISSRILRHLVGHLQRNKVKEAVALFDVIQSVDSIALAKKIATEAGEQKKKITIYVQYNVVGKENRSGFCTEKELVEAVKEIRMLENEYFKLDGLMGIARPLEMEEDDESDGDEDASDSDEDPAIVRAVLEDFKTLRRLARENHLRVLSMGMSDDYELALEAGSTMVRIGSAIFTDEDV